MPSNPFKKSYFRKRIFPRDAFCFHKKKYLYELTLSPPSAWSDGYYGLVVGPIHLLLYEPESRAAFKSLKAENKLRRFQRKMAEFGGFLSMASSMIKKKVYFYN